MSRRRGLALLGATTAALAAAAYAFGQARSIGLHWGRLEYLQYRVWSATSDLKIAGWWIRYHVRTGGIDSHGDREFLFLPGLDGCCCVGCLRSRWADAKERALRGGGS